MRIYLDQSALIKALRPAAPLHIQQAELNHSVLIGYRKIFSECNLKNLFCLWPDVAKMSMIIVGFENSNGADIAGLYHQTAFPRLSNRGQ
jgi:hypothetical protein